MIVQCEELQDPATGQRKVDQYWFRGPIRKWQAQGRPYSLRAYSTNLLIIKQGKEAYGDPEIPDNLLLAVLPDWVAPPEAWVTCGERTFLSSEYASCLETGIKRAWMSIIPATGFLALEDRFRPPRAFSGRSLLPPSQVDWRIVRGWIEYCDANHGAGCGTCPGPMPIGLKLKVIDCRIRAIVELTTGQQYIALSYVWSHTDRAITSEILISCRKIVLQ
jgi:hypothetical protein